MKTHCYILALFVMIGLNTACSDGDAPLPSDYTNIGVESGSIDNMLIGQWRNYVITQTTYAGGQQQTQPMGTFTGDIRFERPAGSWNALIIYNFPYQGMFEVRRYGERLAFYKRDTDQHLTFMLAELSPTKAVLEQYQQHNDDYFVVTTYTLSK